MEFYRVSSAKALEAMNSSLEGLSEKEVEERIEKYGKNVFSTGKKVSFFSLLLAQFKSYLVWLLVFVAAFAFFAGFYLGNKEQVVDGVIISVIIVINSFVGAYQDYKSEKTAKLLKSMMKTKAVVLRGGRKVQIDAEEIVPGDVVFLSEGSKVPADCRIIESKELKVDESMLTGESKRVSKSDKKISEEVPLAERANMLYMNTYVTRGQAKALVVRTGAKTEVGRIAKSLEIKEDSPFMEEIDKASKKITYVALALILFVLAIFFVHGNTWVSVLMMGSALIIGSIPEGLPAIVTFTLSLASLRLAKKNVLVKRKSLLETLGSVNVLCTDKTGTLTENKLSVKKMFFEMNVFEKPNRLSPEVLEHFSNASLLVNEAKDTDKGFVGDSEDIALINLFNENGIGIGEKRKNFKILDFEPFSSDKKYASALVSLRGRRIKYFKGAPEIILKDCDYFLEGNRVKKILKRDREKINYYLKGFSGDALRNIAFSYQVSEGKDFGKKIFLGFVGMYDRPKEGVKESVQTLYAAGIKVKMITGDSLDTAVAIAKECGFEKVNAVTWEQIKDLSAEELKVKVDECNVFARMSPEFKLKIVSALQMGGNRVAITGDGVNDVPALKKAEVGIVMGANGTDIAKEAADLILLDDNIRSVIYGVKEGRTIFSNVRKVINYLLTANLAEVFVVFLGAMVGLMPFSAIQLLWVNFVTDIAPAMALGVDAPHKDIMKKKPTGKNENLINKKITLLTIFIGLKKVVIIFGLFYLVYKLTGNLILAQTMSFTWLVISHFVRISAIRFDEGVGLFSNKYVNWAVFGSIMLQLIILYTPLNEFFHVVPLTIWQWLVVITAFVIALLLARLITYFIDKKVPRKDCDY